MLPLWYTIPMLVSIIVPCYNEEEALPHFKARLDQIVAQMEGVSLELLFVNDGSTDGTGALLTRYMAEDPSVRALTLSRNSGKEAALLAGLSGASGDLVAVMDADLQDPPELLLAMLHTLRETGCDAVAARRVTRVGEPPVRSFFARTFYKLMRTLSPVRLEDGVRDFRLMRREMIDAILRLPETRRFSKGLFAWVGFDVRYIEYENVERVAGVTKWSFWALLRYALEGVFCMSAAPLSLSFVFALVCCVACVVSLCLGLFTAALLCGLSAVILFALGIFGLYVARAYWEAKRRPLYLLKKGR